MSWTEEAVELLKQRWAAGASSFVIAKEFGVTRNTIMGKVTRLKLAPRRVEERARPITTWTDERDAVLRRLYSAGTAKAVIAETIGVTFAAVRSRLVKLGLQKPRSKNPGGRKSGARRGFSMPAQTPSWACGDRKARILRAAHMRQTMVEPEQTSPLPPISQRVTFAELKDCHCRYPFGTIETGIFFCGAPKVVGSYCLEHDMLCRPGAYPECEPVYPKDMPGSRIVANILHGDA